MLEQMIVDTLVVIGMFILRIGVPLAILFGIAAWLERRLRPSERRETNRRASGAQIIPFARPRQDPEVSASAPACRSAADTVKRADSK